MRRIDRRDGPGCGSCGGGHEPKRIPSLPIVERPDAECEEMYPRPVAPVKETSHSKHRPALEAFSAKLPDDIGRRNKVSLPWIRPLQRIETVDEPRARTEAQGQLFDASRVHRDDFRNMLIWGDNKLER